jgi:nucleotide-binding universal stress UspA family protein
MKVLLAVDADNESVTAVTARLFPHAEFVVFSAVQLATVIVPDTPLTGAAAFPPSAEELALAESVADDVTSAAQRELVAAGEHAEVATAVGSAGAAICEQAEAIGADVVVVGRTGRGWLSRLVDPSVSEYVVKHAGCPVLVVHVDAPS